jgi:hypothetical protein
VGYFESSWLVLFIAINAASLFFVHSLQNFSMPSSRVNVIRAVSKSK